MNFFLLDKMTQYDDVDADILKNYQEFSLASLIYFGMKEGAASEQSARMTAMDNATKNAGMIQRDAHIIIIILT